MTTALLQDAAVTLIALSAAFVLVRNTIGMFRPSRNGSPCASCGPRCATSQTSAPAATAVPLRVVRRPKA